MAHAAALDCSFGACHASVRHVLAMNRCLVAGSVSLTGIRSPAIGPEAVAFAFSHPSTLELCTTALSISAYRGISDQSARPAFEVMR
jgi:hypothetical protein